MPSLLVSSCSETDAGLLGSRHNGASTQASSAQFRRLPTFRLTAFRATRVKRERNLALRQPGKKKEKRKKRKQKESAGKKHCSVIIYPSSSRRTILFSEPLKLQIDVVGLIKTRLAVAAALGSSGCHNIRHRPSTHHLSSHSQTTSRQPRANRLKSNRAQYILSLFVASAASRGHCLV